MIAILSAIALVAWLVLCAFVALAQFHTHNHQRHLEAEHRRIAKIKALQAELDRLLNS